jgi:FHA domain
MADACCLHSIKEDGSRGEEAYNLSTLFADAASAAGQCRIGIGRTQPISPVEGVPLQYAVLCSRTHAELSVDGHALLLRDGGGMNGTYVNDTRLPAHHPMPLHDGDIISFGGGRTLQQMVCAASTAWWYHACTCDAHFKWCVSQMHLRVVPTARLLITVVERFSFNVWPLQGSMPNPMQFIVSNPQVQRSQVLICVTCSA